VRALHPGAEPSDREAARRRPPQRSERIGGKRPGAALISWPAAASDLAGAEAEQLADCLERARRTSTGKIAAQLVAQARVQQQGTPVRLGGPAPPWPDLERGAGCCLYDIESDPDARGRLPATCS